jgi:hypothetical protein
MSANIAFSLCAAVASLLVLVLAGLKGDWAVVVVYGFLLVGFLTRARLSRRAQPEPPPDDASPPAPSRDSRLRGARFRRR